MKFGQVVRREHILWVVENMVLRGLFKANKEEVTGGLRKLCMWSFIIC
jgi:hypothetical protein